MTFAYTAGYLEIDVRLLGYWNKNKSCTQIPEVI